MSEVNFIKSRNSVAKKTQAESGPATNYKSQDNLKEKYDSGAPTLTFKAKPDPGSRRFRTSDDFDMEGPTKISLNFKNGDTPQNGVATDQLAFGKNTNTTSLR